jgi:hypothetical protein
MTLAASFSEKFSTARRKCKRRKISVQKIARLLRDLRCKLADGNFKNAKNRCLTRVFVVSQNGVLCVQERDMQRHAMMKLKISRTFFRACRCADNALLSEVADFSLALV